VKTTLFHITSQTEAKNALAAGSYLPAGFAAERFIHCSYAHQLLKVAELHFPGRDDLVLLEIERAALACPVVDENLEGGAELFPHIYGELPMTAVTRIHPFSRNVDGHFALPSLEVYDA
jgi:uncharacterized protein (DUF952 family)